MAFSKSFLNKDTKQRVFLRGGIKTFCLRLFFRIKAKAKRIQTVLSNGREYRVASLFLYLNTDKRIMRILKE